MGGKAGKILDPGGFLVEKAAPKELKPFTGLHGTARAMKPEPVRPPVLAEPDKPASNRSAALLK